jgi:hypothetical protein
VDYAAIKQLLEKRRIATIELLTQAQFQDVEPILILLERLRPAEEVSVALMERMAIAPLSEFTALKGFYFRHFAGKVH